MFRLLVFLLLLSAQGYAQESYENTRDFFPPKIEGATNALFQKVKIVRGDSIFYNYYEYFYTGASKEKLVSKTYDSEGELRMLVHENITDKGVEIAGGFLYQEDENGLMEEIAVKTKKSITYPFVKIKDLKNWKSKTKAIYGNKVTITSTIKFVGAQKREVLGKKREALVFSRKKLNSYSKDYEPGVYESAILFTYVQGVGLGDFYYGSELISNNFGTITALVTAQKSQGSTLDLTIFTQ